MFLSLAVVTSLVTLSLSATYNTVVNLPTVQWDFIIVGGIFLVSVVKMLQHADTFQPHRRYSRISPCQQTDRKSSIQCPCSWSRSHVWISDCEISLAKIIGGRFIRNEVVLNMNQTSGHKASRLMLQFFHSRNCRCMWWESHRQGHARY